MDVYQSLLQTKLNGKKSIAVLIDPDQQGQKTHQIYQIAKNYDIHLFFVGGSLLTQGVTEKTVAELKSLGAKHVVLFPGHEMQIVPQADAILFMSLVSGRNPEYLIGKQVAAAPLIKKHSLEAIPTAYMLVESGKLTSALYISGTHPLPSDKPDIALATALASEYLGMKVLYLDAGSGAQHPVPTNIISTIANQTNSILFVGGGIRSTNDALNAWNAGANYIVVGNGIFDQPALLEDLCNEMNTLNSQIK